MIIELNIGLNVEGSVNTQGMRDDRAVFALDYLRASPYTQNVLDSRRAQSKTEDTLIVRIQTSGGANRQVGFTILKLAHLLQQDCIALYNATDRTGELIGPNAAAWGEFNPEFFIRFEEGKKAVVLSSNGQGQDALINQLAAQREEA